MLAALLILSQLAGQTMGQPSPGQSRAQYQYQTTGLIRRLPATEHTPALRAIGISHRVAQGSSTSHDQSSSQPPSDSIQRLPEMELDQRLGAEFGVTVEGQDAPANVGVESSGESAPNESLKLRAPAGERMFRPDGVVENRPIPSPPPSAVKTDNARSESEYDGTSNTSEQQRSVSPAENLPPTRAQLFRPTPDLPGARGNGRDAEQRHEEQMTNGQATLMAPLESTPVQPHSVPPPASSDPKFGPQMIGGYVRPITVGNFGSHEPWMLHIEDCQILALLNNKMVRVQESQPLSARLNYDKIHKRLAATFSGSWAWSKEESELVSTIDVAGALDPDGQQATFQRNHAVSAAPALSIKKPLQTGGELTAEYTFDRQRAEPVGDFTALNPSASSTASISIKQPLFKGRGWEYNRIPLLISLSKINEADLGFNTAVNQVMYAVEEKYWNLTLSYRMLDLTKGKYDFAKQALDDEIEKLETGDSTRLAVANASNYFARIQLDMNNARYAVMNNERELRSVLGIKPFDGRMIVVPKELALPQVTVNFDQALAMALQRRPEIPAMHASIEQSRLQVIQAKRDLLPQIDLFANYSANGLDNNWSTSFQKMLDGKYGSWAMGVTYERQFGNYAAKNTLRQAELAYRTAHAMLDETKRNIEINLLQAFTELEFAYRQYEQGLEVARRGREQYEASVQKFEVGDVNMLNVFAMKKEWDEAQEEAERAIVSIHAKTALWEFAKGALFDRYAVLVTDDTVITPSVSPHPNGLNEMKIYTHHPPERIRKRQPEAQSLFRVAPEYQR